MIRRVALLSTPWPLFNRPSIQLGTLKAYLQRELPEVKVDAHHVYLGVAEAVGYDLYKSISERSWLSEACYAALLYPEREETVRSFWSEAGKGSQSKGPTSKNLCRSLKEASEADRALRALDELPAHRLLHLLRSTDQLSVFHPANKKSLASFKNCRWEGHRVPAGWARAFSGPFLKSILW